MFIFVNKRESKKKIVVFFHGYPVTAQNIKYMDYKTMFIRKSKEESIISSIFRFDQ